MTEDEFEATFNAGTKIHLVFQVLKDRQWHCRECEYAHVKSSQIAGGSGIQGLQRGTKTRPGMDIKSDNHLCLRCEVTTRQDRWTGHFVSAVPGQSMPQEFARRVQQVLGSRDIVDNTERSPSQLTVDHKLPMLRWDAKTERKLTDYANMTDDDIRRHFQLLRASNGSVSHNLLKSRSCEACFKTGRRGKPFGINFFYRGGERWKPKDRKNPKGCKGCGWYDLDKWRTKLNERLRKDGA